MLRRAVQCTSNSFPRGSQTIGKMTGMPRLSQAVINSGRPRGLLNTHHRDSNCRPSPDMKRLRLARCQYLVYFHVHRRPLHLGERSAYSSVPVVVHQTPATVCRSARGFPSPLSRKTAGRISNKINTRLALGGLMVTIHHQTPQASIARWTEKAIA